MRDSTASDRVAHRTICPPNQGSPGKHDLSEKEQGAQAEDQPIHRRMPDTLDVIMEGGFRHGQDDERPGQRWNEAKQERQHRFDCKSLHGSEIL